jgi:hypothetical protein
LNTTSAGADTVKVESVTAVVWEDETTPPEDRTPKSVEDASTE